MAVQVTRLSGEDWQEWALQLLCTHYQPTEFVKIADNQRGDAGIEGYSRCGHAYQCYGCEEPISTEARYEKQRDKLTKDIGKFIDNKDKLIPLLGTVKVVRWVLFVPYYDSKDIVSHANRKCDEVLKAALSYVGQDFQIHVCDEGHFTIERDQLLRTRDDALTISSSGPTTKAIDDWTVAEANSEWVQNLNGKLLRLNTLKTYEQRDQFCRQVLRWYLEGQEVLTKLRDYPQIHERVLAAKAHRENGLVMACLTHEGSSAALFNQTLEQLLADLRTGVREVASRSAESLAREAVSDWLLRCPLDFPG
jgi:hypothetical protein